MRLSYRPPNPLKPILGLLVSFIGAIVGLGFEEAGASRVSFKLYKDVKDQIRFVEYTPEERVAIVKQAEAVFDIYVNLDSKKELYGSHVDPLPSISDLLTKAPTMSDAEFHFTMSSLFTRLRDPHTTYDFPGPYN
ncbi:hypothetical protein HK102_004044, partial [Quaeritorhiza haematococci]